MRKLITITAILSLALVMTMSLGCTGGQGNPSGGSYGNPGAGDTGSAGSEARVVEKDTAFSPAELTVKVGETVTFENQDPAPHNVEIDGQELGQQNQGESKTWTPDKPGTFPYSCTIHPSMTGEVVAE